MKPRRPFVARWSLALSMSMLLTMPGLVRAQAMPGHDLSSMPGVDMGAKPAATKSVTKTLNESDVPASPALPTPAPDTPMKDHDMSAAPGVPMDERHDAMPGMDHGAMQKTPAEAAMEMPGARPDNGPRSGKSAMDGMPMGAMPVGAMPMGAMQGGAAPPDARDPDAYADGLEMGHLPGMDMADDARHLYVLIDRLEATRTHAEHGQSLDAQAWYGGDLDRLWFKVDGERSNGRLGATRTEALWNHAIATYWGVQSGVRQDFGDGPGRTWAAFGVQGLSPYWFDVEATAYVGEGGRTALRFETEHDLSITQRLILQPDVKVDVFGRDDARRAIGAGLSQVEAGLRLRYEITRKLAPYVGVVWKGKFGNTARLEREVNGAARKTEVAVGVHFWF